MSNPYLGEIRLVAFGYPPQHWADCNGQLLGISQNAALFSLLGTTYGGDGQTTFALPNLQGRVPMHRSGTHVQGQAAGEQNHSLLQAEVPSHTHQVNAASGNGTTPLPAGNFYEVTPAQLYAAPNNLVAMNPGTVGSASGLPHDNMQPHNTVRMCIALVGIFPSRN